MLKNLVNAAKSHLDKSRRLPEFRNAAVKAVQDGVLTVSEIDSLERLAIDLELSESDVRSVRSTVLSTMLTAVQRDQRLSTAELESLDRLYSHFGVLEREVSGRTTEDLNRMRLLFEIDAGHLPELDVAHSLVMKPGEFIHWAEPCEVFEQRSRDKQLVHISAGRGTLLLTSLRAIFVGSHKNYEFAFAKLTRFERFVDGLELYSGAKSKPPLFRYDRKHADVVAAVVAQLVKRAAMPAPPKPAKAKPAPPRPRQNDISRA